MFAYCLNNPVCLLDSLGAQPTEAVDVDGDGEIDYYIYAYTTHAQYISNITIILLMSQYLATYTFSLKLEGQVA